MYCERDFFGFLAEAIELSVRNARSILIFIFIFSGLNALGFALGLIGTTSVDIGGNLAAPPVGRLFSAGLIALLFVGSYSLLERFLASCGRARGGKPRILAYLLLSSMMLIGLLGLVLGIALLVIPAMILFVRWSAAPGFLLGQRRGVLEALTESWTATRRYAWSIFFAALVLFAFVWMVKVVLSVVGNLTGEGAVIGFLCGVGNSLTVVFGLVIAIGVYNLVSD